MSGQAELDVSKRLVGLLDHLGIKKAHLAIGNGSIQVYDLMRLRPSSVASVTLLTSPLVLDVAAVRPFADRLACITGQQMTPPQRRNLETIAGWEGVDIVDLPPEYPGLAWSDLVRDNTALVVETLARQTKIEESPDLILPESEGVVEGIRFRVAGSGPPILLFPHGLAPTQWDAAMPALNQRFTTIRLGGKHLGFIQVLEERASSGTYIQGVRAMFDLLRIGPGDKFLEVGTGTGALARDLAASKSPPTELVAVDVNDFLLDEARFLARTEAPTSSIRFEHGDAESLPFPDGSFDAACAITVLEECDAAKAIAELHRVLKPGGRAGVIVRSRDLPRYWNLDVSDEVRRKLNAPFPESVAPAGCVDAGIYQLLADHFAAVTPNPFWRSTSDLPMNTIAQATALLSPEEQQEFEKALKVAREQGTAFAATPFHCVVGTKR